MIQVAKIGRTVGVHGGVKLHALTDFPQIFQQDISFFAKPQSTLGPHEVQLKLKTYQNGIGVFEGYEDIKMARKLTNRLLFATLEDTRKYCKLKKNEIFYFDAIGCEIWEEHEVLGVVRDIQRIAQTDYLIVEVLQHKNPVIKLPKSFMIPYIQHYILDFDLANKKIYTQGAKEILLAS